VIKPRQVLFVCDANMLRSPTAEKLYSGVPGLLVKSAGLNSDVVVPVTLELVAWADIVFVMERRQRNKLHKLIGDLYDSREVVCLYIPDEYALMDPVLVHLLKEKLSPYLGPVDEG
jgi:predicted protein tyrosine phosphatase